VDNQARLPTWCAPLFTALELTINNQMPVPESYPDYASQAQQVIAARALSDAQLLHAYIGGFACSLLGNHRRKYRDVS
jgi:hypothetical protein